MAALVVHGPAAPAGSGGRSWGMLVVKFQINSSWDLSLPADHPVGEKQD